MYTSTLKVLALSTILGYVISNKSIVIIFVSNSAVLLHNGIL